MPRTATRKRLSTIQLGRAFDSLQGSSEARLKTLLDQTGFNSEKVIKALAVYKARVWAKREFPSFTNGGGHEPPKSKEDVVAALNKVGSIVKAAKVLKTTPITLTKWIGYYQLKQTVEYGGEKRVSWR